MKEFLRGMLGEQSAHAFGHAFAWAMIGAVISILIHATRRDPLSVRSPVRFSWAFFMQDNALRILLAVCLIVVTLRFCPDVTGIQLSGFVALLVGFGHDKLAQIITTASDNFYASLPSTKNKPTDMEPCAFPTIIPDTDTLTSLDGVPFPAPVTATELVASDARFYFEKDDLQQDVLCINKAVGGPQPVIDLMGSGPVTAEPFIGGRAPRRRPRPF